MVGRRLRVGRGEKMVIENITLPSFLFDYLSDHIPGVSMSLYV
jgi:hypothetical protein